MNMNIPVKNQKVVVYKQQQNRGLIIKIEALKNDFYPPIKLFKNNKN